MENEKIKYMYSEEFGSYGTVFEEANYFNISNLLQEDYETIGYLQDKWTLDKDMKIRNFITEHKLKFGDFIFCGSRNPLGQHCGWKIISKDLYWHSAEFAICLLSEPKLKENNIKYKKMFEAIICDDDVRKHFFVCDILDDEDIDLLRDQFIIHEVYD